MDINNKFIANGSLTTSNTGGIEIEVSPCGDGARLRSNTATNGRWQEIKFDRDGEAYVTHHGRKYGLDEFMRV